MEAVRRRRWVPKLQCAVVALVLMGSACTAAAVHRGPSAAHDPDTQRCDFGPEDVPRPEPEPEFVPITVDASLSAAERTARGEGAYADASEAYNLGEWEKAAVLFEEASAYLPENVGMVFNAGQAWLRAGACCRGRQRLRAFLDRAPEGDPARAVAEQHLASTRCVCTDVSAPDAPAPDAPAHRSVGSSCLAHYPDWRAEQT